MMRRWSILLVLGCAGLLGASAVDAQECRPPEDLQARLRTAPTAAVFNELGNWFGQHEDFACAADAFGSSLQADPKQRGLAGVIFLFGSALYFSGDAKEAIPALRQAEQLGYNDDRIHLILGAALDARPDARRDTGPDAAVSRAEADAEWRQALAFDPESTAALDALSSDLLADRDVKGVVEALEQPRLLGQRSTQQALNLARAYEGNGKPGEALRVVQDAFNTYPDSAEIAHELADLLRASGRAEQADAVLLALEEHSGQKP